MTREEISRPDKKDLLLQVFCIGAEAVAILILVLMFIKRFLPVFFTKAGNPLIF